MNIYLVIVISALTAEFFIETITDLLNIRNLSEKLPAEAPDFYDKGKYALSQSYLKHNTLFSIAESFFFRVLLISLILGGFFGMADTFARHLAGKEIASGLLFAGIITGVFFVLQIPFSYYHTFVIEEKYGFNTTSRATFIIDLIKSAVLGLILGGAVFSAAVLIFMKTGPSAWLFVWLFIILFQIFVTYLAPVFILPLFNKYEPVPDGSLKSGIEEFCKKNRFSLKGVFRTDGSRRSTKANAFFTGFGRFRRVVLYDTLINDFTEDEIIAVTAHEIGHYRKKHISINMVLSIVLTGFMLWMFSFFLSQTGMYDAFRITSPSVYAGIIIFGFVFSPINMIFSPFVLALSRHHEYAADGFAAETTGKKDILISALRKLSAKNLSNLTPHKMKVFLEYSHPPVLDRIRKLKNN